MISAILRWTAALLLMLSAAAAEDFLPPDQAFQPEVRVSDEGSALLASWTVTEGYYLYRSRIRIALEGVDLAPDFLTEAELKQDPYFGPVQVFHGPVQLRAELPADAQPPFDVSLAYQGCAEAGLCYSPQTKRFSLTAAAARDATPDPAPVSASRTASGPDGENAGGLASWMASAGTFWILGTFFVLGLGLTFTPCVLPMIPILAGIIAGQGEHLSVRKGVSLSLAYVLGMATTYSLAGVLVGFFGARLNLQSALQNPIALSLFAAVFVALALAMFGFYELQLPAFVRNRLNSMDTDKAQGSGLGRYGSVALMGLVSALVVSPCVSAPLAGALIYISTTGDAALGGGALFMLSLGMGAPLLLVGAGGGRLLPKAGIWMVAVKNFFGVVLLAIAISLVARFLPGPLSLALWGLLALVYAAHLGLGGDIQTGWQKTRRGLAAALMVYSGALLVGSLAGQSDPLQPLAALSKGTVRAETGVERALFQRTASVSTLNGQLAAAQASQQSVVLDLYADWCTSCKEMEQTVFNRETNDYGGRVRFLQLDISRNSPEQVAFLQQHRLFGPPALLYFRPNGDEQAALRTLGEIDLEQWHERMQTLLATPAPGL